MSGLVRQGGELGASSEPGGCGSSCALGSCESRLKSKAAA